MAAYLTPQPAGLTVGDGKTLMFGFTRKLNDHFDLDFTAGLPPEHKVYGRGTMGRTESLQKLSNGRRRCS
jgi:hypothetical protein